MLSHSIALTFFSQANPMLSTFGSLLYCLPLGVDFFGKAAYVVLHYIFCIFYTLHFVHLFAECSHLVHLTLSWQMVTKGHIYLNKPATEGCRFVQVCMAYYCHPKWKGLLQKYISSSNNIENFQTVKISIFL